MNIKNLEFSADKTKVYLSDIKLNKNFEVTNLKEAKIKNQYEGKTFILFPEFEFKKDVYERCANGKGEYKNRGNKRILGIKYTPDFIGKDFIIECKGRPNESFPIRWKMFKRFVYYHLKDITLYKPQNQKECDETVNLILGNRKN